MASVCAHEQLSACIAPAAALRRQGDNELRPCDNRRSATVTFFANNELALHVADPSAAEEFYTRMLGCIVVDRTPDCVSLTSGALRLYLLRDPAPTHDAVVPSFDVPDRAAALVQLLAAGCTLVAIGPHAPGESYVRDPHGIIFDVIERPGRTPPAP